MVACRPAPKRDTGSMPRRALASIFLLVALIGSACGSNDRASGFHPTRTTGPWRKAQSGSWRHVTWTMFTAPGEGGKVCASLSLNPLPLDSFYDGQLERGKPAVCTT